MRALQPSGPLFFERSRANWKLIIVSVHCPNLESLVSEYARWGRCREVSGSHVPCLAYPG